MGIQPTQYYLQRCIPIFDGFYIVYNVSHKFSDNVLTTTFKGYRLSKSTLPIVIDPYTVFNKGNYYSDTLLKYNITEKFNFNAKPSVNPNKDSILTKYSLITDKNQFNLDYSLDYKTLKEKYGGRDNYIKFIFNNFAVNKNKLLGWTPQSTIDFTKKECNRIGIKSYIILGIMEGESNLTPVGGFGQTLRKFNANPQNAIDADSTAYGMGQTLLSTYESIKEYVGVPHYMLWIPEYAITATVYLVNYLLKQFNGDLNKVIYSYTGGKDEYIIKKLGDIANAKIKYGDL
jgi:hypothetical protein